MYRYRNRSTLLAHTDKAESHVISVIMNIAQEVEEEWPLYIKDHENREHTILLKAGEMLWYESARLVHGRQKPFKGKYFDNMFIHYKPKGLWYKEEEVMMRSSMKISKEALIWSQRNLKDTNWQLAWDHYEKYESNKQFDNFGAATQGVRFGDGEDEKVEFRHIHPMKM